ncbi:MAG: HvfB family MNIO-type RiPP peptide maturase [Gammaproteobacteria bacterium]
MPEQYPVKGAGLGLRRAFIGSLADHIPAEIDFMEVAPENWIDVGGRYGRMFSAVAGRIPMLCHGLSLNIGGPAPLDEAFLHKLKNFLDTYNILAYSEHLTYCADDAGHLYDLLPIPFTGQAVRYVADRVKQTQDITGRQLALENASYYAAPGQEMPEIEFINSVLEQADCGLLLDINNIHVNSINHRYDAEDYLKALPGERIVYAHIAGHDFEAEDLRVDTHGADVIDPVWQLLETAYEHFGVFPTLLERDFNIPGISEMLQEVNMIHSLQQRQLEKECDPVSRQIQA